MNPDVLMVFDKMPAALPLYEMIEKNILSEFPDVTMKVGKTQIGFRNRYGFAYVSPPVRKVKGRPETYVILTFGLPYRLEHPHIAETVEPYPNRWTHHIIISEPDDMDDEVMGWIKESYDFAMIK